MGKCHAYRNIELCTKDCLCLFVCPTGATNNETGQIDFSKCIGCGSCANACPSRAITMIPNKYPPQQKKSQVAIDKLFSVARKKIEEVKILNYLLEQTKQEDERKLYKALLHSNKVIIEDLMREAGYMLPQSKNTHELLEKIRPTLPSNLQKNVDVLLERLPIND